MRASEYCHLAETRVVEVVYDAGADRITRLRLEDGRELETRYVFDASNQARVIPKRSAFRAGRCQRAANASPSRITDATPESRTPAAMAAHKNWILSSNVVRLFEPVDGVHGVAWCIPIGDYVSMGISRPSVDDLSDEAALALLERSMADRGIRYRNVYPELAGTQSIETCFYVHDRVCGANWILAGQTGCQGWFSTLTGIESSLFCASIADKLLESPGGGERASKRLPSVHRRRRQDARRASPPSTPRQSTRRSPRSSVAITTRWSPTSIAASPIRRSSVTGSLPRCSRASSGSF